MAALASSKTAAAAQCGVQAMMPVKPSAMTVRSCFASAAGFRAACGQKVVVARR